MIKCGEWLQLLTDAARVWGQTGDWRHGRGNHSPLLPHPSPVRVIRVSTPVSGRAIIPSSVRVVQTLQTQKNMSYRSVQLWETLSLWFIFVLRLSRAEGKQCFKIPGLRSWEHESSSAHVSREIYSWCTSIQRWIVREKLRRNSPILMYQLFISMSRHVHSRGFIENTHQSFKYCKVCLDSW